MNNPSTTPPRLAVEVNNLLKRSLSIAGHRTSISLEPEFWTELKRAAEKDGKPLAVLVGEIDSNRGRRNLSSAIRVWLLSRLQSQG